MPPRRQHLVSSAPPTPARARPRAGRRCTDAHPTPWSSRPRQPSPNDKDSDETNESVQDGGRDSRDRHDRDGGVRLRRERGRCPRPVDEAAPASTANAVPAAVNLAQGRPTQESGHADVYDSSKVVDGNAGSYWESVNNAFPQWVQVDLGSSQAVNQVVLKLPTSGWGTRTQTLSVQGSTNGSSFGTLVGSQTYTFNPASGSTVTINFTQASTRYVRITITANSGWPAGQLSELEVYGSGGGTPDTTAPSAPSNLSYTQSGTTITLNWVASTDNPGGSGIAGYDVYRNGSFLQSIGNVLTFNDTQPATATVSYYVRARDVAGNLSGNSNTVTRTGSGDTTAPSVPGTLSHSTSGSTITLNWGASTDSGGSGLAGYNVYRNGSLIATLGTVLTYQDSQPATATVSYYVRARDGAGNLSGNSNTVTRTGSNPCLHQRGAGQGHVGQRFHLQLHPGQGERRAARDVLGGCAELPAEPDRGAGREPLHLLGHRQAQPGPGLGHPYADHPGPRPRPGLVHVHQSGVGGELPVRPGQQRGEHPGHRDHRGRPAPVHRQLRCPVGPGGRA
ncbi:hypothetical protein GCM10027614_66300 [Micromonospora vulcania]